MFLLRTDAALVAIGGLVADAERDGEHRVAFLQTRPSTQTRRHDHGAACRQPPDQAGESAQPAAAAAAHVHLALFNNMACLLRHLPLAHALRDIHPVLGMDVCVVCRHPHLPIALLADDQMER